MTDETDAVSRETAAVAKAVEQWPTAFPLLQRYHEWLATAGVERGLIGPREADKLWDRHINNSAVLSELVPADASVIDVGSGAGLPGIPLQIVRPDLTITLLEPLARRVEFLEEVIADLGLSTTVVRGRAEDQKGLSAQVVTSRAVAALPKLLTWCWPLVSPGGSILALKGAQAAAEIEAASKYLTKRNLAAEVRSVGAGVVDPLTTVVSVHRRVVTDLDSKVRA